MKTEAQVRQKLKQVIFRHRKEFVREGLSRRPQNCAHNRTVRLPVHTGNRASLRVCDYRQGDDAMDVVCDPTMAGDEQAQECPFFACRQTASSLKEDFKAKLGLDGSPVQIGVIASEYPDVAALMWVMGPGKNVDKNDPEDAQESILALFGSDAFEEPETLPRRPLVEDGDDG